MNHGRNDAVSTTVYLAQPVRQVRVREQEGDNVGGIASRGQLRMSFLRWAIVTVPLILLLGFAAGASVARGYNGGWYLALAKPAITPPAWVFPIAWTTLYILLGLALALILHARGSRRRGHALSWFAIQFVFNLCWTPLFFGAHQVHQALWVNVAMVATAIVATVEFGRIRKAAAWLMVPYLVWISFACVLTWRIDQMNPDAETLVPSARTSQML